MKRNSRSLLALSLAGFVLAIGGCVNAPPATSNANAGNVNANSNATTLSSAPTPAASPVALGSSEAQAPVTLPVLDGLFADEAFAGELKSKVGLTDEQIEKLRSVAREETASLREGEADTHGGTTSAATARAAEKIEAIIGKEKAPAFATFVRERWNEGALTASAAKPNAVPTDTRIVVNAPAYRMDVFENGQLVKSYKIGIGYPEFPLPQGMRKASSIIFNPTWTPPDEPWVEGSRKVKVGQKVEAGSPLNPLGPVKIPIGMPSLIHGGKSPAKLGTFASHGCVGLTNPQVLDFSLLLAKIGGAELTQEDVAAYGKKKTETKNVKLANTVPVELRYETIVAADGKLHIYRDVYEKNTNTEANLRAVLEANGVTLEQLSEQERAQALDALKQMARDASGQPTDAAPSPTPATAANKNANQNADGRVTSTIKGKKEVVIEVAALKGKGYPAPAGEGFESPKPAASKAPAKRGAKK
jgi:lipoprotein-anchoring transpeptidase ErfK/SrfK